MLNKSATFNGRIAFKKIEKWPQQNQRVFLLDFLSFKFYVFGQFSVEKSFEGKTYRISTRWFVYMHTGQASVWSFWD